MTPHTKKKAPAKGAGKKRVPATRSASPGLRPKKKFQVCEFHRKRGEDLKCEEEMAMLCEHGPGWRDKIREVPSAKRGGAKRSRPKSSPSKRGAT